MRQCRTVNTKDIDVILVGGIESAMVVKSEKVLVNLVCFRPLKVMVIVYFFSGLTSRSATSL